MRTSHATRKCYHDYPVWASQHRIVHVSRVAGMRPLGREELSMHTMTFHFIPLHRAVRLSPCIQYSLDLALNPAPDPHSTPQHEPHAHIRLTGLKLGSKILSSYYRFYSVRLNGNFLGLHIDVQGADGVGEMRYRLGRRGDQCALITRCRTSCYGSAISRCLHMGQGVRANTAVRHVHSMMFRRGRDVENGTR
jgi:hypothetical protein